MSKLESRSDALDHSDDHGQEQTSSHGVPKPVGKPLTRGMSLRSSIQEHDDANGAEAAHAQEKVLVVTSKEQGDRTEHHQDDELDGVDPAKHTHLGLGRLGRHAGESYPSGSKSAGRVTPVVVTTVETLTNEVALAEVKSMPVSFLHTLPTKTRVWAHRDGKNIIFTTDKDFFSANYEAMSPSQYSQLARPGETFGELSNRLGYEIVKVDVVVQEETMTFISTDQEDTAEPHPPRVSRLHQSHGQQRGQLASEVGCDSPSADTGPGQQLGLLPLSKHCMKTNPSRAVPRRTASTAPRPGALQSGHEGIVAS